MHILRRLIPFLRRQPVCKPALLQSELSHLQALGISSDVRMMHAKTRMLALRQCSNLSWSVGTGYQ